MSYPVMLELTGRRCVVIGGGRVAARRTAGLLEAGALVTAVAPVFSGTVWEHPRVTCIRRPYIPGDAAGAQLLFACTDSPAVNAQAAAEARSRGILANVCDAPDTGDFFVPAVARDTGLTAAVTADGFAGLAARIRDDMATLLHHKYAPTAHTLRDYRRRSAEHNIHDREGFLRELLALLDNGGSRFDEQAALLYKRYCDGWKSGYRDTGERTGQTADARDSGGHHPDARDKR